MRKVLAATGGLFASLISACSGHHLERTLVYENSVYHWRIEHVVSHYYPAGDRQYYEVFLKGRLLVIPADTFNDTRDIDHFIAAGGFEIGHWRNKHLVVSFENIQRREDGEHRLIRSVMLTPDRDETIIVTDLLTGQEVGVERVPDTRGLD